MSPDQEKLTPQPETELTFPVKEFAQAVKEVAFAAAKKDYSRPVLLESVFLTFAESHLELVAADGFRLSWRKIKTCTKEGYPSREEKIFIPARSLKGATEYLTSLDRSEGMLNFAEITLRSEKDHLELRTDKATVNIPIVNRSVISDPDPFSKWREIIPSTPHSLVFERKALLEKIRLFNTDIRVEIAPCATKGKVLILSEPKKLDTLDITGYLPYRLLINSQYLRELLSNVTSTKELILQISCKPDQPLVFRKPDDEDFLHLIMPMLSQQY